MIDQNVLTTHCQKIARDVYDHRKDYIWARTSANKYLVAHKKTFESNDSKVPLIKISFQLPKYSNVYIVDVEKDGKFMKCSCQHFHRLGIPCAHVCSILNVLHPQMFHPRYYVIYNSWLYNSTKKIKSMCNSMLEEFSKHDFGCNITGLYHTSFFKGEEYGNACRGDELEHMKATHQMHISNVPLLRGETPPEK